MKNKELGRIPKNITPEIAHMSSKGQIVIPKKIRDTLAVGAGDPFAIFRTPENTLILKPIKTPSIEEDLKALKEINKAWERVERGEYRKAKVDGFLKELEEW
ncbi:MAG: AbrB/MazE/SpoVT family DNA-binding domain-containing protein [Candidatus Hydrothermarchaeales archaeon]